MVKKGGIMKNNIIIFKSKFSFQNIYGNCTKKAQFNLSLSENPLGCSSKALEAIKKVNAKNIFDYPSVYGSELAVKLGAKFNLLSDCFLVGNGSEALINLICKVFIKNNDEVLIPSITFSMFREASGLSGGNVVMVPLDKDLNIDLIAIKKRITTKTRLIFLCSPNNPTGKILLKSRLIKFIKSAKSTVVLDEANIEFGGNSLIREVNKLDNLIIVRTFSKGFGLAGLRIGFIAANKNLILTLKNNQPIFPVSGLAIKAAISALEDDQFIINSKQFMKKQIRVITRSLRNLGFRVVDSQANNLFFRVTPFFKDGKSLTEILLKKGVSVVDGSNFGMEGKDFIRISPRDKKTNLLFITILSDIVSKQNTMLRGGEEI